MRRQHTVVAPESFYFWVEARHSMLRWLCEWNKRSCQMSVFTDVNYHVIPSGFTVFHVVCIIRSCISHQILHKLPAKDFNRVHWFFLFWNHFHTISSKFHKYLTKKQKVIRWIKHEIKKTVKCTTLFYLQVWIFFCIA